VFIVFSGFFHSCFSCVSFYDCVGFIFIWVVSIQLWSCSILIRAWRCCWMSDMMHSCMLLLLLLLMLRLFALITHTAEIWRHLKRTSLRSLRRTNHSRLNRSSILRHPFTRRRNAHCFMLCINSRRSTFTYTSYLLLTFTSGRRRLRSLTICTYMYLVSTTQSPLGDSF